MSPFTSNWGLRLLALALAILAWFILSVGQREQVGEQTIEPFVTYRPPDNYVILNPAEKVRLRVRGPASRIATLNPIQVSVRVDLRDKQRGTHEVALGPANVALPEGLEVVSIDPNILTLQLDREISQLKPIDALLTGEPAAGAIAQEPSVVPLQALVRGPESRVNQLAALTTQPVTLDGHALDFDQQAAVISPDPLVRVVEPSVVTVKVRLDIPNTPPAEGNSGALR